MEAINSIIEGDIPEINIRSIHHEKLKVFHNKCAIWDFYDMTREEYTNKPPSEKEELVFSYYKKMVQGMLLLFVLVDY